VAFLPADLDRRFGRDNLPDHANLLANLVHWTAREQLPCNRGRRIRGLPFVSATEQACVDLVQSHSAAVACAVDELNPRRPVEHAREASGGVRGNHIHFWSQKLRRKPP